MNRREIAKVLALSPMAASAASSQSRRKELYTLLGDLPDRNRKISATKVSEEDQGSYILEKLTLDLNGVELVPALFAKPKNPRGRTPAVLYNHAHGGTFKLGKLELTEGRSHLVKPSYAEWMTGLGYSVLCIDTWAFGDRSDKTQEDLFKEMIWNGRVLWGMMVYDSLRAMDYLVSRDDVDAKRIGTVGLSMGSAMAQWTAALDERVKVTVDLCCLTDWHALMEAKNLKGHGIYYYVPSLLKHFTTSQMNALIAPRHHLALAGNKDALTPPKGLDRIDAELKQTYLAAGHPERWELKRYNCGHQEPEEMRAAVREYFSKNL